jgi:hypothetical protein
MQGKDRRIYCYQFKQKQTKEPKMTNETMTTKFEVGKKYNSENGVKTYTVLRRTEKTVWMETEDNKTIQKRIKVTNFGNEKITDNFLETTSDCETLEPVMEPQGHLQIGGVRFYQFFQDMNVNVPTDWDILEDPIYYTTINGQVVLYNDITREMYVGHETLAIIERRAMIDSFNYHASLLHQTDEDSQEYDEIWEKMMSIHDKIKNLETLETT